MEFIFIIFFAFFFVMFFAIFFTTIAKNVKQWSKNNHSPKLTVEATVVTKRTLVRGDHAHTTYYATFEVESGDRMELELEGYDFGMLVEGDQGKLSFQGTRFLGFDRI